MRRVTTIKGSISPKSIQSNQHGLFFAQNMMYRHTVTVYNRDFQLVATISDKVSLPALGNPGYPGEYHGSPVEAAITADGRYVYVSNYEMYGPGFNNPGHDNCSASQHVDDSFVYRIDAKTLRIDQAIKVGATPKYLALTPDDKQLLVSNWCSYNLSVVDVATATQVAQIPIGRHPRGITVSPDGKTAYVAVMGEAKIAAVDLATDRVSWTSRVGPSPRGMSLSPNGRWLYVSLNGAGKLVKFDTRARSVVKRVPTGQDPRSMVISPDGTALYVVNNLSNTVSEVATSNMRVLQTLKTDYHPIGITYDAATREVWVSCYGNAIDVYRDS